MTPEKDQFLETTEDDIRWTDDDGCDAYLRWDHSLRAKGYRNWPDHVPMPLDEYDYRLHGPAVLVRPACSLWHRFIFRLPTRLAWWLYAKTGGK